MVRGEESWRGRKGGMWRDISGVVTARGKKKVTNVMRRANGYNLTQ